MEAPESIKQLIRKIHTLSLRGVGGEAEAAKRKLDVLLAKYSIPLDDVLQDVTKTYEFPYKTELERRLIIQCYASMGVDENSKTYGFRKGGRRMKIVGIDLTPAQYIDLKRMVDYYRITLKKETDRLFMAFVQQHKLYPPPSGEGKAGSMSLEEIEQIMAMMRGLGEKSYFKPAALLPTCNL